MPDTSRVFKRLETRRKLGPIVAAEVMVLGARRDDERIVWDCAALFAVNHTERWIDIRHFGQEDARIPLFAEDRTQRESHIGGRQLTRCNLVEKRLKEMKVAAVEQRYFDIGTSRALWQRIARQTRRR